MPSHIWSRDDIRNILLAIYAAKLPAAEMSPPQESPGAAKEERAYLWGCRVAIQSLMLAFGLPLQVLDEPGRLPPPASATDDLSTEHWWLEDLENVVAAVHRSATSTPVRDPDPQVVQPYLQGFTEIIASVLQAVGSRENPQHWLEQTLSDRYWEFLSERDAPFRLIGGPPGQPPSDQE